jgi:ABC-type Zn2+ transport system substrate-binding protein/surface adhesin
MQTVLSYPSVEKGLRHEGWNSSYECGQIDAHEDLEQFERATCFIDTYIEVIPAKKASGKVTSLMLKEYHERKCKEFHEKFGTNYHEEHKEHEEHDEHDEHEEHKRESRQTAVIKPKWYGDVSHGVFILAAIASGLAKLGPSNKHECGSSYLKIAAWDWKDLL